MSIATAQPKELRHAYTLVELLVVMAALTVLAAVLLPSIKSLLHDQKVAAASRMVKAHVEAAQARAIGGNSPVAVIFERNANFPNMVTRLSIGQVFPPYEGDMTATMGTLSSAGSYYDTLTVPIAEASLLSTAADVFTEGDYLQLDDRQSIYQVLDVNNGVVTFANPAPGQEEGDLRVSSRISTTARFRLYRKPTKSFLQTLTLPRGTCVDLSVSGLGPSGDQFVAKPSAGQAMIVFNSQGRIAYWSSGNVGEVPQAATSLMHLLVGRTEQVSTSTPPMEVANPDDASTFNANINDTNNAWLTVNPFTGAISSSGVQAGNEGSTFAARLQTARAFATYGITQSEK